MKKKLIIFLILSILILIVGGFWWMTFLPEEPSSEKEVIFTVKKGEGSREIALNLEKAGLIKWGPLFRLYVLFKDVSGSLQAGTYELSPSMAIPQIAKKFASGETLKTKVTIPEGFTMRQIEEELTLKLQTTVFCRFRVEDFKEEFDFLKGLPDNASLEGFLFPDTYFFEPNENDEEIFRKFLKNFEKKITLYQERISDSGKTIFETVKMASLLEREVRTLDDKKLVSGILWKRLENKIPLQVDATVTYITGKNTTRISIEETKIDSPYNTYKYPGLPVGPISNPGLESILAAISPQKSDFWYYLSTTEGETIFNKTLKDHNIDRAEFLR